MEGECDQEIMMTTSAELSCGDANPSLSLDPAIRSAGTLFPLTGDVH
jgi:hypothetical protein